MKTTTLRNRRKRPREPVTATTVESITTAESEYETRSTNKNTRPEKLSREELVRTLNRLDIDPVLAPEDDEAYQIDEPCTPTNTDHKPVDGCLCLGFLFVFVFFILAIPILEPTNSFSLQYPRIQFGNFFGGNSVVEYFNQAIDMKKIKKPAYITVLFLYSGHVSNEYVTLRTDFQSLAKAYSEKNIKFVFSSCFLEKHICETEYNIPSEPMLFSFINEQAYIYQGNYECKTLIEWMEKSQLLANSLSSKALTTTNMFEEKAVYTITIPQDE